MDFQPRLVQNVLEHNADLHPDKTALIADGQRLSYDTLEQHANAFANTLIQHGVKRGDRVVLFLPNSVPMVVAIFGTLKAGAAFVAVNPTTKQDKLEYILSNCRASAMVTWSAKQAYLDGLSQSMPDLRLIVVGGTAGGQELQQDVVAFEDMIRSGSAKRPQAASIDLDLACLVYTSGSTGEPKGVMTAHANMLFAARSIAEYLENTEDDIVLNVLPLSFDYGLYQLIMTFSFGGTLVLEKGFTYPAYILERLQAERVTGFPGVPTIFAALLSIDLQDYDLSSLRYLTNTAAALPPAHILQLRAKFPGVQIYSMYGLTETKRTLYLPPDQLDVRPGSVGIAIPGTEVWIEDETGHRMGPGEIGELIVRGRHVMLGYWGDAEASEARYAPGPFPGERVCRTGDLFRMDFEGYFYFVGRTDDIIKSRGEKVAPKEVEEVIYRLKGVREAAVVGFDDPVMGQGIRAYVVLDGQGLQEKDILSHCRAHLESFMVPNDVQICETLPKTSSGKIAKKELP